MDYRYKGHGFNREVKRTVDGKGWTFIGRIGDCVCAAVSAAVEMMRQKRTLAALAAVLIILILTDRSGQMTEQLLELMLSQVG